MESKKNASPTDGSTDVHDASQLVAHRRDKLERWRSEGADPWGRRVDGLVSLAEALAMHDEAADEAWRTASEAKADGDEVPDLRARARVAGRCVQHRAMGRIVFLVLRDHSGDMQISCSREVLPDDVFRIASKLDYGDIVVAEGPVGTTRKGERCVWADRFELHCKSLAPPPEKWHGLSDPALRCRHRYVDMYANPETIQTFQARSAIVSTIRRFMDERGYLEVETPMLQALAGGAAARPFVTHHNAMDLDLFLRIAPELYLKRLLVGGMPRVYEINRNFRNEGIDRQHNPEFTMLEAYEAFGDQDSMLDLTEDLLRLLARSLDGDGAVRNFDGHAIDYGPPFDRVEYAELFERTLGCAMEDDAAVRAAAGAHGVEEATSLDHWLLVSALFDRHAATNLDPARPTFVLGLPSMLSPLTRPDPDQPQRCFRAELFIGGMEISNTYTELNDPDLQRQRFTEQLAGSGEHDAAFRTLDEDFLDALHVGMPPAGGFGLGVDRVVMLMTGRHSIRDVILFPLVRPEPT